MIVVYTIILNYNNYKDTFECIDCLNKLKINSSFENNIVLVDNASSDDSGNKLKCVFKDSVVYIQNDINSGYAAGNNVGIKFAIDNKADYICVLNNDTVADTDFYSDCINYLIENKNIGFVSPAIENFDNNLVQSTGGDILFEKGLVTVKNNGVKREELPREIESDYLGGACLIFNAKLVEKIGYIPENYFLFFEETEWCWKAKLNGMFNVCLSTSYIKHKGSASIDSINGLHAYLMERNRVVFLRRNTPSFFVYVKAMIYLIFKYVKKGLLEDKEYFKYLKYMNDGWKNRVDEKYPFVCIRN